MDNDIWGEMKFHIGFKTAADIEFDDKKWNLKIKAQAYKEKDGLAKEQEKAFIFFRQNQAKLLEDGAALLDKNYPDWMSRLKPDELLFKRDGSFAMLFNDQNDLDNGIALQFAPDLKIMSQDDYL